MTRFLLLTLCSLVLALTGAGCTVLVDGTLAGRTGTDAGTEDTGLPPDDTGVEIDAGPPVGACTGMADGIRCMPDGIIEPFVCIDEVCVLSTCGDGARDDRSGSMHEEEECDDGNASPDDGCDPDCTFSCSVDGDCDDLELCSGIETCNTTTHVCEAGTAEADGTRCVIEGTKETAACRGGLCRAGACPDGILDAGEECDPAATPVPGDGCEDDCTFTCEVDSDCQDTDACNGNELCDVTSHVCLPSAAALDCDDVDPCTTDSCDATSGCANASVLVDADGDRYFAITSSCGGDDCDDANPARFPGATEACGATLDLNCDGSTGVTPVYYRDCDGDGFAASTSGSVTSCTPPAPVTGCSRWITLAPTGSTTDCLDTSVGANARPNQTSSFDATVTGLVPAFDFDCDRVAEPEFPTSSSATTPPARTSSACTGFGRECTGARWYVRSFAPSCGSSATISYCGGTLSCARMTTTTTVRCH